MSAASDPGRPRPASPGRPARALWIIAGDCAILALAAAQAMRGDQRLVVVLTCGVLSLAAVAVIVGRAVQSAARSGLLMRLLASLGLAGATLGGLWAGQAAVGWRPVALALAAFAGLALVLRWLVAAIERQSAAASPWHDLAAGPGEVPRGRRRDAALAVVGALLLVITGVLAARSAISTSGGPASVRGLATGIAIVTVLIAAAAAPVALVSQVRARRASRERELGRQRQAVAAHLHDSVLQTLALIQRSAGDEQRVQHLARQQERGLRAWLAGRTEVPEHSVAAALGAVAAEVEDEAAGTSTIEVITVADAPMSAPAEALVQAAREALRNATRHAGGVVRVVLDPDVAAGTLVVFVRDTGAGFDLAAVPVERRGIRDAIIGRMEHANGLATFDSGPDGTEVELRVPLGPQVERA